MLTSILSFDTIRYITSFLDAKGIRFKFLAIMTNFLFRFAFSR